jgi:hypothetical protein
MTSSRTSSASAGSQKKQEREKERERTVKKELETQHARTAPAPFPPDEETTLPLPLQRTISGPPYSVFSPGMKSWIIFLVSISALISPFGATLVLPALTVLTGVLDITPTQANISITTYMVSLSV